MKIAIIGAGINGLYLAWKLSKRGEQVIVFEKRDKIGKEACSGLFSERILEFIPQSQKLIENEIDSILIYFPKRILRIKSSKKFFVINHFKLDNLVAKLAQNSGARILLNHPLQENKDIFSLLDKGFEKIIGCDGPNSIVRKSLNLREPNYRLGIQGFINKKDSSNYVKTWPTKNGFIWKIPRGEKIEWGIIEEPGKAKPLFDQFLEKNNLFLSNIKSSLIPGNFLIPRHASIILCGDAAGLVKPWSGGGVIWGLIAADLLLKNFPDFLKYQEELKKFFLSKIIFSKIAVKVVYFFGFNIPWLIPKNTKIESDFLI